MKAILDSSVLIAFFTELKDPKYLLSLTYFGYELHIPNGVAIELKRGITFQQLSPYLSNFNQLSEVDQIDLYPFKKRFPYLAQGELEVLFWGLRFKRGKEQYICVLDDKKARNAAEKLRLNYTGTIGILNLLEELDFLASRERKSIIEELRKAGFRVP